jgi:RES domain-containing protein
MNTFPLTITAFRCVPNGITDALATTQTLETPGRWNTSEFSALYTFLTPGLVDQWVDTQYATSFDMTMADIAPASVPDLLVLNCSLATVVDLTSAASLNAVGLPSSYPDGYQTNTAYSTTQPIGTQLFATGCDGLLVRSATASIGTEQNRGSTELVIFANPADCVTILDRIPYSRWSTIDTWPDEFKLDKPVTASLAPEWQHRSRFREEE